MTTLHTHNQRAKRAARREVKSLKPITTPARSLFNSQDEGLFLGKEFSLGDVLSITTGRLLSERHMDGVYDILNWMTGDNLYTHQLPRDGKACEPWLIEQYPQLDPKQNPKLQTMLEKLTAMLETEPGKQECNMLIRGWLCRVGSNFWGLSSDDKLTVYPLVGKDKVLSIELPSSDEITQVSI
jgi:hypothetical protein